MRLTIFTETIEMITRLERINQRIYALPGKYFTIAFWVLIGASMVQFIIFKYAPSLDGPQHLHNAYVLKDLVFGQGSIPEFYSINPLPVGYWTTQILLTLFTLVLPPDLAEKMLILTYVAGIALAYRYFLRSFRKEYNPLAQFLIFPFIPSFFLLAGYYAFSFGVVVFLLLYGYWNNVSSNLRWSGVIKFSLLLLLLYFTHGVVFTFFLVSFFIYYLYEFFIELSLHHDHKEVWRKQALKAALTITAFIPALIVLFIYSRSVVNLQLNLERNPLAVEELVEQLIRIRPLIGFHHDKESVATIPLFLMLILVGFTVMIQYAIKLEKKQIVLRKILQGRSSIFLLLSLLFLLIYFLNPDRFIAGTMTLRVGFFFFLFLIMWIPFNRIPLLVNLIMGVVLLFAVTYNQALMPSFYKPQVKLIEELQELDNHLEEGATVYSLRESDNWLTLHHGLYIGLPDHHVNLTNPQCYGAFPMIWNKESIPAMFAGKIQLNVYGLGRVEPATHESRQVDYITVFYHDQFMNNEANVDWKAVLENDYELLHMTSGGAAVAYRRKNK